MLLVLLVHLVDQLFLLVREVLLAQQAVQQVQVVVLVRVVLLDQLVQPVKVQLEILVPLDGQVPLVEVQQDQLVTLGTPEQLDILVHEDLQVQQVSLDTLGQLDLQELQD